MTWSGLTRVTVAPLVSNLMSEAFTGPVLLTSMVPLKASRLFASVRMRTFLRLRTISVTSSTTPSIGWNSCCTPSIVTAEIAAPSMELSRMRRRELPTV
jgi:hypothetical protein